MCSSRARNRHKTAPEVERERPVKRKEMNTSCRLCHREKEDIFHIVGSCSHLSSNLYLNARHNKVAAVIYEELRDLDQPKEDKRNQNGDTTTTSTLFNTPPKVTYLDDKEIWWDMETSTTSKIAHNRPDIVLWNRNNNTCKVIDICVPMDMNCQFRETKKRDNYMPLVGQLQRLYPNY